MTYEEWIFKGFYPRMYDQNIQPGDFFPFYFETYVQRDVRQIQNIRDPEQMKTHYLKGSLFENMMIMEMVKHRYNLAQPANLWFYRDNNKNEIDCIYEGTDLTFIEIKSARTFSTEKEKALRFMDSISESQPIKKIIVYGGDESFSYLGYNVISWKTVLSLFDQ